MVNKSIFAAYLVYLLVTGAVTYAAPITQDQYNQQQTSKRQAEEQTSRITSPSAQSKRKVHIGDFVVLPKEPYRFKINVIQIDTGKTSRFTWLNKELEKYEGRLIGAQGINALHKMLVEKLVARGFITTRVVVPEQNLKTGKLVFKIIPGYIKDIKFENPKTFGTWKTAFPTKPGDILNVRNIEQGIEQMKRVPNQNVEVSLQSGKEENQSIVVLKVKRSKMWSIGMSYDDGGLESTGRHQATGNVALYNPTGLNDIFSYNYTKDAEHKDAAFGTKNYSFSYSVPYKNYTFNINKYYGEFYEQVPAFIPFESRGKTTTWDFGVQRLLYRDNIRKTQALVKVIKRRKESYIDGEEIKVQRLNTAAYQLGLMHRQYIGEGIFDGMVYYQKGVPWFGAEPGIDDFTKGIMTTRYSLVGLNLYYGTPFLLGNIKAMYSFTFRGQYTKDALYGSDQFSIGGRYTVRGFSGNNTLAAENGYIARNEISFPFTKVNMEPYLGVDYGRVWGPSDEYLWGNSLAGGVIGIRGKLAKDVNYDVFIGTPIYKPQGFKAGKTACGFNLYWQI